QRRPDHGSIPRKPERRRQNADDRTLAAVHHDIAMQHGGVAAKLRAPEVLAQKDNIIAAGLTLGRVKYPPEDGLHAESSKIIGRHVTAQKAARLIFCAKENARIVGERRQRFENVVLLAEVALIEPGRWAAAAARRRFEQN